MRTARPAYHRLHHAREDQQVNLGVVLTIWDVLDGCARFPSRTDAAGVTGLAGRPVPVEQNAVPPGPLLLASHALAAGPLAASQPGFTVLDPLSAALLGVFLFGETIQAGPWDLVGEALALALVIAGAWGLSRSCFILGEFGDPSCLPEGLREGLRARSKKLPDALELERWGARPGENSPPSSPG